MRLAADGADPVRFPHAVTATDAWDFLQKHKDAVLIDVRTKAEWMFVGVPDLSSLGNQLILLEWQVFPTMGMNRTFPEQLTKDLPDRKDVPLFFLCRSGARSQAAADVMAATGYAHCVNIADGFEGDLDPGRHRGRLNGWKASGLPWVQT
ncbi:MAG: rhodanese-like domain-containing protein [Alphaproteobacteria bacterium]